MNQSKRTKIMLLCALVLMVYVLFPRHKQAGSSSGPGIMSAIAGVDINQKVTEFINAKDRRDMVMKERMAFWELSDEVAIEKTNFWEETKSRSLRSEVQQKLSGLTKIAGIEDARVSTGFERPVSGCQYIRQIRFTVSSRKFTMKNIADFMDVVDDVPNKIYWSDCKISNSGKNLTFTANLQIYVLNREAVELLGEE